MKVGNIGVLQHLKVIRHLEETPAKIIEILSPFPGVVDAITKRSVTQDFFIVKTIDGKRTIYKHQIRPLKDPDQTIEKEEEEELV